MSFPDPKTFLGKCGTKPPTDLYKQCNSSSTSIGVLPELVGKPWNDVTLAYVLALNPTSIRVGTGGTMDARVGRVSVRLYDNSGMISSVEQEVHVCLPDGISNGHTLEMALLYGKDSEEVRACL